VNLDVRRLALVNDMLILLMLLSLASGTAKAGECGNFPEVDFRRSSDPKFTGTYRNYPYGYRVRIPRGLAAYGTPAPAPSHGAGIILSWEPRSYLFVDGTYNVLDFASLADAADQAEGFVREDALKVLNVVRRRARLGRYPALRITMRHTCGSGDVFVTDKFILLKRDIVYTVTLIAPESRYRSDRTVLEAMAQSFELTSRQ
jgi:hypothetical protein